MIGVTTNREPTKLEKPYTINRLILIGNGFDLAHGLKTRYSDFLLDYFNNAINTFLEKHSYKDELFEIAYGNVYRISEKSLPLVFVKMSQVKEKFEQYKNHSLVKIRIIFHSVFFESLFEMITNVNWVDIENQYFDFLLKIKERNEEIEKLNFEFDILKNKLEDYLLRQDINRLEFSHYPYTSSFTEKISQKEITLLNLEEDINPDSLYFLVFNYTDIIYNYVDSINNVNRQYDIIENFIHGKLDSSENPMIFGYGDEHDLRYKGLEVMGTNKLYAHIKSFWYSLTENYQSLIRFINSNYYQVCIYGHSCGLSDRTMLKEIFEHDNCVSIKTFYHLKGDSDDFVDKAMEISRHFDNKGLMRKKLVPKAKCSPMPRPRKLR